MNNNLVGLTIPKAENFTLHVQIGRAVKRIGKEMHSSFVAKVILDEALGDVDRGALLKETNLCIVFLSSG